MRMSWMLQNEEQEREDSSGREKFIRLVKTNCKIMTVVCGGVVRHQGTVFMSIV